MQISSRTGRRYGLRYNQKMALLYREKGYWGDATLLDTWNLTTLRHADKTAIVDAYGTSYTFKKADELADKLAAYLIETGVVEGDIVSAQLPGWAEFLIVYAACLKTGAVLSPIHTNLRCRETHYILDQCKSKVVFIPYRHKTYKYAGMLERMLPELPQLGKIIVVDKFSESNGKNTLAAILEAGETPPLPGRI